MKTSGEFDSVVCMKSNNFLFTFDYPESKKYKKLYYSSLFIRGHAGVGSNNKQKEIKHLVTHYR